MKEEVRTKYANLPHTTAWAWLLPALLLVLVVRLHGLSHASLADFDSVRNWQIVRQLATGNVHDIFHHRSPGFYLFFLPLALLKLDFHWYLYSNAVVSVVALGALMRFIGQEMALRPFETALLALLVGTSTFLTFSGRDFSLSSLSLLLFVTLLRTYYRRWQQPSRRNLLRAAACVALGLTVDYKFLLTLPVLGMLELLRGDGLLRQRGIALRVLAILATPYLVLGLVGWLGGLPWWRWPATYYDIVRISRPNAAGRTGNLQLNLLYYPRFLLDFESPLSWLGMLLFPWLCWREIRAGRRLTLLPYLAVWAYCWFGGMSLLLKAPRGLLFAYGLFVVMGFLVLRHLTRPYPAALVLVALLGVGYNLRQVQGQIYAYTPTHYDAVAAWLHAHNIHRVVSTVGLSLAPFVAPDSVKNINDEHLLPALRRRGYRYVLFDGYWRVTNIRHFDSLRRQRPIAAWPEPMLTSPLQFLEHSEFTALSYTETLRQQRAAQRDTAQLRLFRINHELAPPQE